MTAGDLSAFVIYAMFVGGNVGQIAGVISQLIQVTPLACTPFSHLCFSSLRGFCQTCYRPHCLLLHVFIKIARAFRLNPFSKYGSYHVSALTERAFMRTWLLDHEDPDKYMLEMLIITGQRPLTHQVGGAGHRSQPEGVPAHGQSLQAASCRHAQASGQPQRRRC